MAQACKDLREALDKNKHKAKGEGQEDVPTQKQSGDEDQTDLRVTLNERRAKLPSLEAQDDLRVTLNERRSKEVEITQENIESIIQDTVYNEQDPTPENTHSTDDEEVNKREYLENLELSPKLSQKPWPRPWPRVVQKERDETRPFTPPSPLPTEEDPDIIPQTPPEVQKVKKTHSPIVYDSKDDTPKRSVRDWLGPTNSANPHPNDPRDETPRSSRSVRDRLGDMPATTSKPVRERLENVYLRRSKRQVHVEPFKWDFAPRRDSEIQQRHLGSRPRRELVPSAR